MQITRRNLLSAAAVAAAVPGSALAAGDTYPLWVVRKGGAEVFLFGDGGAPGPTWSSPRIEAAFDKSRLFWKETPTPRPEDRPKYVAAGVDRARPLSTWLTADQKARVAAAAQSAGITYGTLEPLKPWLASIVLANAYGQKKPPSGNADPLPILSARAEAQHKPVQTELADGEAAIRWADGMSPAAQVEYLLFTIETQEADRAPVEARMRAWAAGDLAPETAEVVRLKKAYPAVYPPLVADRNRAWPARFAAMLADGGTSFVLVGADHLLGPDSVLVQLSAAGLPARRV
jgi:uncharacterized protein YbaP (TraB family)